MNGLIRVRIRRRLLAGDTARPLVSKGFQGVVTKASCSYAGREGRDGFLCGSVHSALDGH